MTIIPKRWTYTITVTRHHTKPMPEAVRTVSGSLFRTEKSANKHACESVRILAGVGYGATAATKKVMK